MNFYCTGNLDTFITINIHLSGCGSVSVKLHMRMWVVIQATVKVSKLSMLPTLNKLLNKLQGNLRTVKWEG
jgi:hypothetical protein